MVTADDVAGLVVKARLEAATGYATTLPGAAWFGRAPETPAGYPYCVFQLDAGEARLSSGGLYSQAWIVRLAAYCPRASTDVAVLAVQKIFFDALCTEAANTAIRAIVMRNASEKALHGRPLPGQNQYAREMRNGADIFIAGQTVEILVMGDRSAI